MFVIPHFENSLLITPNFKDDVVETNGYFDSTSDYVTVNNNIPSPTYAMENANSTPKEGNTTVAFIKGIYTPTPAVTYDPATGQSGATLTGGTFWRVAIKENGAKVGYKPATYYNSDPSAILDPATEEAIEYPGGVTYYALCLKNQYDGMAPYTVKRNSFYKIDVTSVQEAGEPDEGDLIDPEIPLEGKAEIEVEITIEDWDAIPMEGGL